MSFKRTLRVRTVFKGERPQRGVRRLAPLLVLLFILPSLSGCLGGSSVDWGDGEGEYSASLESDETSVTGITVNNNLADNTAYHYPVARDILACDEEGGSQFHLNGWLVRTKIFDNPISNGTTSVASWIVKIMPYEDAQDVTPGSLYFSVLQEDKDWATPTRAEGYAVNEPENAAKTDEFPHEDWATVAMVPSNENIFDAVMQMEGNQAVRISGYTMAKGSGVMGDFMNVDSDCNIQNSGGAYAGVQVELVVTSITYDDERVVSSSEEYIAGDIPFVGRGLYTTMLLISIVASGALYIFSRNQIMLNADTQAQSMLSDQQMRAGKAARHEAARHEARMEASAKAKEAEYSGRPTPKTSAAPSFDIGAALAEEAPGTKTEHYVAGSSVTSTDDADAMQDMISDMQEGRELEQKLQEKGLRGIIDDASRGGGKRRTVATVPHTSRLSKESEEDSEPEAKPKRRATKRTRKTKSKVAESEPVEEEPPRSVDPGVNEDEDFSDFSL